MILFVFFVISVFSRFSSEYLSNFFIFIGISLESLYWKNIIRSHECVMNLKPASEAAEKLQQKGKKQKEGILKEKYFVKGLDNWGDYNMQVIFFSFVFYVIQNVKLSDSLMNNIEKLTSNENIFWLFIQICLYSVIFSQVKINETIRNSKNENQIKQSSKVKFFNHAMLVLCFTLLCLGKFTSICICYLNVISTILLLCVYFNQFKIELFCEASKKQA